MIAGTIALKGTPATAAFQTSAAAEREAEGADLRVGDVAPRREPVEEVLRVLHVPRPVEPELAAGGSGAARVAARARRSPNCASASPIGSMSACDWPSPWKRMTPGQPPAGAVPLGMM